MDEDFLLVWKMKKGDEDAMRHFVDEYYTKILNYCNYHCFDRQSAQDLAQETFARFFGALVSFKPIGKSANYLYVIARNVCIDFAKKKVAITIDKLPEKSVCSMDGIEAKIDLTNALKKLPEELREIIILHFFQGLSIREGANILKIGVPLAKYRIKRAKEQLAVLLGKEKSQ